MPAICERRMKKSSAMASVPDATMIDEPDTETDPLAPEGRRNPA
jgi:hypothetical protein